MQIFEQGQPCSILDLCKEGKSGKAFQALVKASASDQEPPKTLFVVISPVADTVESVEKAAGLLSENWNEIKNFKGIEVQQMWSEDEGWYFMNGVWKRSSSNVARCTLIRIGLIL